LKAFFTTRTGDIGLLTGTAILFFSANEWTTKTLGVSGFSIRGLSSWALSGDPGSAAITMGAIALFIAAIGKSGQFPLHTWLPDAMAGPTPVSSLLHSSTMVVAGVFLVARVYPVFFKGMDILSGSANFIIVIGAITIVIAALLAFVQTDIKKVLAYSTVSQLGYMMMGLGAGAWLPAVFHIFTHAFFKACLFLGAGSISHSSSHHSFEMKKDMGGLRKFMPITFGTWMISTLALCGVFPFSGFFSKDEIIDNVGNNGYNVFMYVGLAGAFLTAAYMTRATYLTFFGEPRGASAGEHHEEESHDSHAAHDDHSDHGHDTHDSHDAHASHGPHESGWLITAPLIILATLALSSGFLNALPFGENWENFKKWVEPSAEVVNPTGIAYVVGGIGEGRIAAEEGHSKSPCGTETPEQGVCAAPSLNHAPFKWAKAGLSMLIVFAGFLLSLFVCIQLYAKKNKKFVGLTERNKVLGFGYKLLVNKYYLDVLYEKIIVRSIAHPISAAVYRFNQKVLDGVVNGAGTTAKGIAGWVYRNIDQRVVDGAVNGSGSVAQGAGSALRPVQSGKVNQYGALLFGAAAIGALVLVIVNT
jgi:NADH-quinone oxidoreductase subunit L